MRLLLLIVATMISAGSAWAQPAPDTSGIGYTPRLGHAMPLGALFIDQAGRPVTLGSVAVGRPTILVLGYYACPALCGVIRDDLLAALPHTGLTLPGDYGVVFLSIDPRETVANANTAWRADLARYPTPGATDGWHFLTGDARAVETAVGFHSRFDNRIKQFIHPAGIVVLTPGGTVSGYVLGVGYQPGDLRAAIIRASSGGIERSVQPVLLLCFHFDPVTGRYTLAIMKVLRLAGLLTVLTLLGLMLLLRRREARP